ncbi:MAG: glycosyltransferase family 9 protein [Vulcanimicrobiaceae bacterium]
MHIVLTRLDRVGDLVLSTPAIATVRKSYPEARITLVCSAYNRVVMERNSDVDDVVALPPRVGPAVFGAAFRRRIDLAIALAPCGADFALVGATRAPVRIGYTYVRRYVARLFAARYLTRLILSSADPRLSERFPERPVMHEVHQLLELVGAAGATQRDSRLRIDITDEDRAAVEHLPANCIVVHLAPRWFGAGSTLSNIIEIIGMLRRRFGVPVVVTHGRDCSAQANAIQSAGVADAVAGELSFHEWAAAFERARCVVTVDTAATHVASAMRRPTVVAFEHRYFRLSSQEWAPYGVPCALIRKPPDESDSSLATLRAQIGDAVEGLVGA